MPLQKQSGTYALLLESKVRQRLVVGKLGELQVQKGFYLYIGSAFGPGGVLARVKHHQKISSNPHWHIDYLRKVTTLTEVWYTYDSVHQEHQWANRAKQLRGAQHPFHKFGASDCECETHLFFFKRKPIIGFGEKVRMLDG